MKYLGGFSQVMTCAHSGMEDIGVSSPLISMKTNMQQTMTNMVCCMVSE